MLLGIVLMIPRFMFACFPTIQKRYYQHLFVIEQQKTATLIREYSQGTNVMSYGLPCGHYDRNHHRDFAHGN